MMSSRPGARATWIGTPGLKNERNATSVCCGSVCNRARCAAKSFGIDETVFMQQIVQNRFDERLKLSIGVTDPGNVRLGVEGSSQLPAVRRCHDHASFGSDEMGAQVVRMTAVAGRDAPSSGKPLDEWAKISNESVLADREVVEL